MKKTLEQIKLLNNKMISYNEFLYICSCGLVRFCERVYKTISYQNVYEYGYMIYLKDDSKVKVTFQQRQK